MKKLITLLTIFSILILASISFAYDLPVDNPQLSVEGNDVVMKVALKDGNAGQDVKVLFHGATTGFSETSPIQPYYSWYVGSENDKTTVKAMYAAGWKLTQMIPYNATAAKQFYLVFTK